MGGSGDYMQGVDPDAGPALRYPPLRLFLIALFFIVVSPIFWHRTQLHQAETAAPMPVSGPAAYVNADLYQEIYPEYHYAFGRLRAGELPQWNSGILCGVPFLANPRIGVFQPLNAIFCGLETGQAMAAHGFLCHALMGIGMVLFARSMGLGLLAALGAGVAYAFCGTAAAGISRPPIANTLAWAPFLFWSICGASRRGFPFRDALLPGLLIALVLLSGAPSIALAFLCTALCYALCHLVRRPAQGRFDLRQRMEWLLLVCVLGIGLSAVQWLPTLGWALTLDRPGDALAAIGLSRELPLSLQTFLGQLLVPKSGALPRIAYLGAIAIAILPAALLTPPYWRREGLIFILASALLIVLSVGGPSEWPGRFPWLSALFPGMFCLTTVLALGLDRILSCPLRSNASRRLIPLLALMVVWWGLLFYISPSAPRGRLIAALLLLVPFLFIRIRAVTAPLALLFIALLFIDLVSSSRSLYRHPFQDAPACYRVHTTAMAKAELQALDARIGISAGILDYSLPSNLPMLAPTLKSAGGNWPLTREQSIWWRRLQGSESNSSMANLSQDAAAPRLLNAMSVKAIMAGRDSGLYSETWSKPGPALHALTVDTATSAAGITPDAATGVRVLANNDALPRAYWTPTWRDAEGIVAACDLLGEEGFNGMQQCIVDRDSPGYDRLAEQVPNKTTALPATGDVARNVQCLLEEIRPETVVLRVNTLQPGITVLTDTWDRGWHATLNGKPCPILRVNGLFRGIITPAGDNEIQFVYRPISLRAGLGVTLGTMILGILIGVLSRKRS